MVYPVPDAPNASPNFAQPWSYSNERDTFGTVRGEFDLSPDVTAWAAAGARHGTERNSLANPTVINAAGDTSTYRFDNARRDTVRTGEIGIRGKLRTGDIGHALSATPSSFDQKSRNAYGLSNFSGFASNLYSPVAVTAPAPSVVTGDVLGNPAHATHRAVELRAGRHAIVRAGPGAGHRRRASPDHQGPQLRLHHRRAERQL